MKRVRMMFFRFFASALTGGRGAALAIFLFTGTLNFVRILADSEGEVGSVALVWARAVMPLMPIVAAIFTMRTIADDRETGVIDLLLAAPIREREIAIAKFLAPYAHCLLALALFLVVPKFILPIFASVPVGGGFAAAFAAVAFQTALWCAVGTVASACTRRASLAAVATILICECIPYGAYWGAILWFPEVRETISLYPPERHICELATGLVSSGTIAFYAVITAFCVFTVSKLLASLRFRHHGAIALKVSTVTVVSLAAVMSALLIAIADRTEITIDLQRGGKAAMVSPRLQAVLSSARGEIGVICFASRREARFRDTERSLRTLVNAAVAIPGAEVKVRYVDPRWDMAAAASLVKGGVPENSVVVEYERRRVRLPLAAVCDETALSSAIQRVLVPRRALTVCFVSGHGEDDPDSYDPVHGYSNISRLLQLSGYGVRKLDLASVPAIPADCSVLVVAGPRTEYAKVELEMIDTYLRKGGRMLYLASKPSAHLVGWGLEVSPDVAFSSRTLTGSDVVASDFADHAVTAPLRGTSLVLDSPHILRPTSRLDNRTSFIPLVTSGASTNALAVALQRGEVSRDLAIRPTRVVAVGTDVLVMNGAIGSASNANSDFLLNAVAWLAGIDAAAPSSASPAVLDTGMDRTSCTRFAITAACVYSLFVFLVFALVSKRRMRRP